MRQGSHPPLALFDVTASAVLTLLAVTEHFGALPGAIVALGTARYILRW